VVGAMELLHTIVFDRSQEIVESNHLESPDRRAADLELMGAV